MSINIKRGDTLIINGTYKQDATTPMNLTGFSLEATVLDNMNKVIAVVSSLSPQDKRNIIVVPETGKFTFSFFDTEVLKGEEYYVDFKITSPSGIEQTSKAVKIKVKAKLV